MCASSCAWFHRHSADRKASPGNSKFGNMDFCEARKQREKQSLALFNPLRTVHRSSACLVRSEVSVQGESLSAFPLGHSRFDPYTLTRISLPARSRSSDCVTRPVCRADGMLLLSGGTTTCHDRAISVRACPGVLHASERGLAPVAP